MKSKITMRETTNLRQRLDRIIPILLAISIISCKDKGIRGEIQSLDWSEPSIEVVQKLLRLDKYKLYHQDIPKYIQNASYTGEKSWLKLISKELFLQSNYKLDVLCKLSSTLSLDMIAEHEQRLGIQDLDQLRSYLRSMITSCISIRNIENEINRQEAEVNNVLDLQNKSRRQLEDQRKQLKSTYLSLADYYILTGFVNSAYGEGVYEIAEPYLFKADGWTCRNATDCFHPTGTLPFDMDLGIRVVLKLNNFHFKNKGRIRVLVTPRGMVPITLKNFEKTSWYSYEEESVTELERLRLLESRLSSDLALSESLHEKGNEKIPELKSLSKIYIDKLYYEKLQCTVRFNSLNHPFDEYGNEQLVNINQEIIDIWTVERFEEEARKRESANDDKTLGYLNRDHDILPEQEQLPMPRAEIGDVVPSEPVYEVFDTYKDPNGETYLALKLKPYPNRRAPNNKVIAELEDGTELDVMSRGHGYRKAWCKVSVRSGIHKNKTGYAHCKWIRRVNPL